MKTPWLIQVRLKTTVKMGGGSNDGDNYACISLDLLLLLHLSKYACVLLIILFSQ